jgi:hypothetical protein
MSKFWYWFDVLTIGMLLGLVAKLFSIFFASYQVGVIRFTIYHPGDGTYELYTVGLVFVMGFILLIRRVRR